MNYKIAKQKCPRCGRFRVLEHPVDQSINVGEAWHCKHCDPGRPSTPEERDYYQKMMADPRRYHIDKEA